jgi:hypothetical protein
MDPAPATPCTVLKPRRAITDSPSAQPTTVLPTPIGVTLETLRWIGFGAFFVASLAVGIRLLHLWTRTRELPELLIGFGVLGIGPFGYGMMTVAMALESSWDGAGPLMFCGLLATQTGAASQYWFVSQVFRPQQRAATLAVVAASVLLVTTFFGDLLSNGLVERSNAGFWFWSGTLLRQLCLGWSSFESLHYWTLMRRRNHLGLGDPVITNRFLLWGLGAGAAFSGSALGNTIMFTTGNAIDTMPGVNLAISMHGLAAAIAMWLAFLPPAAYVRFIQTRARNKTAREYSA